MKVLVTGFNGQLGHDVIMLLKQKNVECVGVGRNDFDITDFLAVQKYINEYKPTVVIHCSAYTAVDKAEDDVELCRKVNAIGTKNIAKACKQIDSKMVYISTDYVFNGEKEEEYEVDDNTDPICIYGKTKLEGEKAVIETLDKYFIVRISWVFGKNGNNFVKTMLRIGKEKDVVNVVSDQVGSPTYTVDLGALLCELIFTEKYGIYHATNEGYCSWADFAQEIFKQAGYSTRVNYITTDMYPTKARRPMNSKMSKTRLDKEGVKRLPMWQDALKRYLEEI